MHEVIVSSTLCSLNFAALPLQSSPYYIELANRHTERERERERDEYTHTRRNRNANASAQTHDRCNVHIVALQNCEAHKISPMLAFLIFLSVLRKYCIYSIVNCKILRDTKLQRNWRKILQRMSNVSSAKIERIRCSLHLPKL